ncbi:MAG TPA: acyloxyacyl hydrolase [Terriglobales bacterium]|nr:acyloxyacyl hydrolase [Terriglobales bacterium]
MKIAVRLCILAGLLVVATLGAAQDELPGKHEVSVWLNRSFSNGHVFGWAQNRELFFAEVRYARRFATIKGMELRYQAAVVPVALLNDDLGNYQREWVYAAGASPIGLHVRFRPTKRVSPFLSNTGGFLYFQRRVLFDDTTQFNFTVELAAGTEIRVASREAVVFGYKYHHFSNANRGVRNPGLDSHMLFVGFAWFR